MKQLHRLWLIVWFVGLAVVWFLPDTVFRPKGVYNIREADKLYQENKTYYQNEWSANYESCQREAQREIKNKQTEPTDFQISVDVCMAYNILSVQESRARSAHNNFLLLYVLSVFIPYILIFVVRLVDGFVSSPDPVEGKIERILRGKK